MESALVLENSCVNTVRAHFSEVIYIFSHHRLIYCTYLIYGYVTDDIYESKDISKGVYYLVNGHLKVRKLMR